MNTNSNTTTKPIVSLWRVQLLGVTIHVVIWHSTAQRMYIVVHLHNICYKLHTRTRKNVMPYRRWTGTKPLIVYQHKTQHKNARRNEARKRVWMLDFASLNRSTVRYENHRHHNSNLLGCFFLFPAPRFLTTNTGILSCSTILPFRVSQSPVFLSHIHTFHFNVAVC